MKNFIQIIAVTLISSSSVYAAPNDTSSPMSYLCTASYLYRHLAHAQSEDISVTDTVVDVISNFSADFSDTTGGGGGPILQSRPFVKIEENGKKGVYEASNLLKDRKGKELDPVGIFSNGHNGEFNFSLQFYSMEEHSKAVGGELKIQGSGTAITQVKANEFIQVSCALVPRMSFPRSQSSK